MKKLTLCLCALAIFIVVACNPQATSSENTNAVSASGSPVATETPAPAQEPGKSFTYNFDNQKLYEMEDGTFPEGGKVGLWTKADSVTHLDDLRFTAK